MNRRDMLSGGTTAVLGFLAGCLADGGGSNSSVAADTNSSVAGEQAASDGDFWMSLDELPRFAEPTVVDFETASLTAAAVGHRHTADGFSVQIDLLSGETASSPAKIVTTVANTKPFAQPIELQRLRLLESSSFMNTIDESQNTMYIVPTESHPLAQTTPEYERDREGRWRLAELGDDWYPRTVRVDGETGFVAEYYLLGHHLVDEPPIVPGRYQWNQLSKNNPITIVTWPTTEPGPDEMSALADRDPPALPGDKDTSWYHESTPETELFLQPDVERVQPPERITFHHVNHSRQTIHGNPYDWGLYKLLGGEWHPIAPWGVPVPASRIDPGGRSETELTVYHGKSPSSIDRRPDGDRTVDYLGGGLYAYTGGYDTETEQYAALFELNAPELEIGIESAAEIIETGATTVVELPTHAEASRPATLTVTRTDSDDPDRELIPEQLPRRQFRGLRNSLPLFDADVESVRVRTDRWTALQLADEENTEVVIRYDDATYRAVGTVDE